MERETVVAGHVVDAARQPAGAVEVGAAGDAGGDLAGGPWIAAHEAATASR